MGNRDLSSNIADLRRKIGIKNAETKRLLAAAEKSEEQTSILTKALSGLLEAHARLGGGTAEETEKALRPSVHRTALRMKEYMTERPGTTWFAPKDVATSLRINATTAITVARAVGDFELKDTNEGTGKMARYSIRLVREANSAT